MMDETFNKVRVEKKKTDMKTISAGDVLFSGKGKEEIGRETGSMEPYYTGIRACAKISNDELLSLDIS
jgi:hypothetical protein